MTVERKVTVACQDCDDFELSKTYRGEPNTPGESEFEQLGGFDGCPVCGGELAEQAINKVTER